MSSADAEKYPHEFSGGQRQRIAVARALATRPAFLVCDEPTSALDVSVQSQILNLMKDLQDELGLTYLFISHNLAVVDHMSDIVGVMYLGSMVELSDNESLFQTPRHPYTRLLMQTMPRLSEIGVVREPMQGEVPNPITPPRGAGFIHAAPLPLQDVGRIGRTCGPSPAAKLPVIGPRKSPERLRTMPIMPNATREHRNTLWWHTAAQKPPFTPLTDIAM